MTNFLRCSTCLEIYHTRDAANGDGKTLEQSYGKLPHKLHHSTTYWSQLESSTTVLLGFNTNYCCEHAVDRTSFLNTQLSTWTTRTTNTQSTRHHASPKLHLCNNWSCDPTILASC